MDKKMWLMAISVGVLLVVSTVQAIELRLLSSSMEGMTAEISTNKFAGGSNSESSGEEVTKTLQNNIQGLQTMVGGC
ncbi:MAG: hypothetical protein GOU98_01035 [Candidatus Altiarchaeota archaeon]|nr:hypothetical protein [Candidatus Altiarchaeota archaeon]